MKLIFSILLGFFCIVSYDCTNINLYTLDELLIMERQRYVSYLIKGIKNHQQVNDSCASELLLKVTADENRSQPEIFQLYRYDILTRKPGGKFEIDEYNIDTLLKYKAQKYIINGTEILVYPFVWNGCEIAINIPPLKIKDLYTWADKWIDINDKMKINSEGLQGVIHNITYPVEYNNKWIISIDFGSAPIIAFKELLDILSDEKAKQITIGSNFLPDNQF